MHSSTTPLESQQPEIDVILKKLLGRFFIIFLITGTVSLAGSLIRVFQFGWMFQHLVHITVYVGLITGYLVFRHSTPRMLATILFTITAIDAVVNIWTCGLASTATLMLGYCIIMTATFIGFRAGLFALTLALAILVFFAAGISTGWIQIHFDAERYLTSWSTWATQISTFIVMMATAILAASAIKENLLASLHRLKEQTADLTQTNRELVESEQKISTIVRTAPEAIITASLDGYITSCNEQACMLLKYATPEELTGIDLFSHITPDSADTVRTILTNALKKQVYCRDIEFSVFTRTGTTTPVKMSTGILYNKDTTPSGYLAILQDITQSKQMEEHMRQAEKMEAIGQLAGGIAHDFNNQLTGILGLAELLKMNLSGDANNLEEVDAIIRTARKAADLTGQLLTFSRSRVGASQPFDLHQLIGEVQHLLQRTFDKSIAIECNTTALRSVIHGDVAQMQSVLLNLAFNARDAMPQGGTITISTSSRTASEIVSFYPLNLHSTPQPYIIISVRDTGTGIDLETQKRIFEPFFTTKYPGKGTGMGLANVYSTVKNHGGTIEVRSRPGEGTEFKIFLPENCNEA